MRTAFRRHRTSRFRFAAFVAATTFNALLVLSGCSKPPDPSDTLESVSSWLATASLAGEQWVVHSTPNPFTRNTIRTARHTVADQQKILFGEAVPAVDTADLHATLDRAKNTMATLEQLIDRGDARLFAARLVDLKRDADHVKQMSDSLKQSQ
jgi:hypothetical protein